MWGGGPVGPRSGDRDETVALGNTPGALVAGSDPCQCVGTVRRDDAVRLGQWQQARAWQRGAVRGHGVLLQAVGLVRYARPPARSPLLTLRGRAPRFPR